MTPLEMCQAELADAKVPTPDFLGEDLTPAPLLLWCFEAAKIALTAVTAGAVAIQGDEDTEVPVMTEVLNGVSQALAGYMYALVKLEVLPQAALDSISAGSAQA